jgi:hypothetical protein
MLKTRLVLLVAVGALSAGGSAAYAATHGPAHHVKAPVHRTHGVPSNLHYPCHSHGAKLTPSRV